MSVSADPQARANCGDRSEITSRARQIDISRADLGSIVWATGYRFDFGWIDLPVLDADGQPRHQQGIAPVRGIYFLGLPWLSKMRSSFLSGVADDAARLADRIEREEGKRLQAGAQN